MCNQEDPSDADEFIVIRSRLGDEVSFSFFRRHQSEGKQVQLCSAKGSGNIKCSGDVIQEEREAMMSAAQATEAGRFLVEDKSDGIIVLFRMAQQGERSSRSLKRSSTV